MEHEISQLDGWNATLAICARSLGGAALLAFVLSGSAYAMHGKVGLEKSLTALALPVGFLWLLLTGYMLHLLLHGQEWGSRRRQLMLLCVCWLLYSLCGSPLPSDACLGYLESRYTAFDPTGDSPLDILVVLGGGTIQGPERAEASDSGDRVVYAAQLYLQGKARKLVATGGVIEGLDKTTASQQSLEIWKQLGIPAEDVQLLDGVNTYGEMQLLQSEVKARSIGLLTSAWHLPRAMRLAEDVGLRELIPVAADHRSQLGKRPLWDYIPSAHNLFRLDCCQREFMARIVQR